MFVDGPAEFGSDPFTLAVKFQQLNVGARLSQDDAQPENMSILPLCRWLMLMVCYLKDCRTSRTGVLCCEKGEWAFSSLGFQCFSPPRSTAGFR